MISYKGALYRLAEENPDEYKLKHGRCPEGYHTDDHNKCKKYHELGKAGVSTFVQHREATSLKDEHGNTPLHELARSGKKNAVHALDNNEVGTVRNEDGDTPLHYLADMGHKEVLKHPMVNKVQNENGETARDRYYQALKVRGRKLK